MHNVNWVAHMDGRFSAAHGVRKGAWTKEEDILLKRCIDNYGEGKWHLVPSRAGLNRCRKSCRLRWMNYLKPDIKRGEFTADEVDLILRLHKLLGNRWALIAGRIPGRTANNVKNYWNTHIRRKVAFSHDKNITEINNNTNDNNINHNNTTAKSNTNIIIKPRPWIFKKQPFLMDKNNTNTTLYSLDIRRPTGYNNHKQAAATVVPVNLEEETSKSWWESLLDDCMITTSEDDGILNSIASATAGNLELQYGEPNNNFCNTNFLSQELADQPAGLSIGPPPNNTASVFVEDDIDHGHQSCWTDFIIDKDLWELDQGKSKT